MNTLLDLLFLVNIGMLAIGHELDAIRQKEWRMFLNWTGISDDRQYQIFTALHLPLFVWIVWQWQSPTFQIGFNIFLMLHAVAHFVLRKHPLINFDSNFSRFWIYGGALLGATHLMLLWS